MSAFDGLTGLGAGSLGSQTDILGGIAGPAFNQLLSIAAWRGVRFAMPNVQEETGRRLLQLYFPGRSDFRMQDFGALDGPIRVEGLIIGDDYVIRAKRMRDALRKAGPATLVHPWLGTMRCRILQTGTIVFSDGNIRLARFSATFVRDPAPKTKRGLFGRVEDTLTSVLETADRLMDEALIAARRILSPATLPLALISAATNVVQIAQGVWNAVAGNTAPLSVRDAAAPALSTLNEGIAIPAHNNETEFADRLATLLVDVPASIASSVSGSGRPAIASAEEVVGETNNVLDARQVTPLLISAASALREKSRTAESAAADVNAVRGLSLVNEAMLAAQIVAAAAALIYQSQEDAITWRDRLVKMLDEIAADIDRINARSSATVPTNGVAQAISDLRAAVTADISERLGRLPTVSSVTLPRAMSSWLIAYSVGGDRPEKVEDLWRDMISRNHIRHPALSGPGKLKLLQEVTSDG
ncbi:DNA-circ-N domain-containing protein [Acetobacteraceae bacterium EV16G]|uniref:DNA-circ-N domain-containing protein n=1 Tax=Sorlinia euscelidii TaxID=3081148 RepID=A0ABU7TYT3_9PROT